MPQPTVSQVHIDRAITNAAIQYRNLEFIAEQVAPVVPVVKDSDKYFIFTKADWLSDNADDDRAPGARAARGGYGLTNATYLLKQVAIANAIPVETILNADEPLKPYEDGMEWCMQQAMLRRERRAATNFFTTSIWGTDKTNATVWSDFTGSDPAYDVAVGQDTILSNAGVLPNQLTIGWQVWQSLRQHPDGIDRFKHTQAGLLTPDQVAAWLNVDKLVIGKAVVNTAKEGAAVSMGFVWGKHALLTYTTNAPSLRTPTAAYIFQRKGVETRRWREEAENQDVVEATIATDPRVTAADAGYFFSAIVS